MGREGGGVRKGEGRDIGGGRWLLFWGMGRLEGGSWGGGGDGGVWEVMQGLWGRGERGSGGMGDGGRRKKEVRRMEMVRGS